MSPHVTAAAGAPRTKPGHRLLLVLLIFCAVSAGQPAAATAAVHAASGGKIWHGVTAGDDVGDFRARTGRQPAIWQTFVRWDGGYEHAFQRAASARARVMLHVSTAAGQNAPGVITPGAIARGEGDGYLLGLNRRLERHRHPVYLRLMGEMNNCDNAYAPYDCRGRRRSADHSARRFRQAWQRAYLIVRGGEIAAIDSRLKRLGMPPVRTAASALGRPPVSFVWAPMTGGSPMLAALAPQVFWPGRSYVDWVGTSFYSRFPNFHYLEPFYKRFAVGQRKPFAFAEWAMWGSDDAAFARRLFAWVRTHRRVRMMQYNQGDRTDGPFRLRRHPRSAAVMRAALRSSRFAARIPEYAPGAVPAAAG